MEDIVDGMRSNIDVADVRGEAFRVGFINEDPRTAMRVAERLASLFIDESLRDREVLAEGTSQFLEAQLEDARRQLIDNEKKLENYRRAHAGQLPTQLNANMQGLHNTEMQIQALVDASIAIAIGRWRWSKPSRISKPTRSMQPDAARGAARRNGRRSLAQRPRRSFRRCSIDLKPTHPDVVRARKAVDELRAAADAEAAQAPVAADEIIDAGRTASPHPAERREPKSSKTSRTISRRRRPTRSDCETSWRVSEANRSDADARIRVDRADARLRHAPEDVSQVCWPRNRSRRSPRTSSAGRSASSSGFSIRRGFRPGRSRRIGRGSTGWA